MTYEERRARFPKGSIVKLSALYLTRVKAGVTKKSLEEEARRRYRVTTVYRSAPLVACVYTESKARTPQARVFHETFVEPDYALGQSSA